jgi:hypothetical protein
MRLNLGALVLCVGAALACSVGEGEGIIRGEVRMPLCGIDDRAFNFVPAFFGAEWHAGTLLLHIGQGGDLGEFSDELFFRVNDTRYVAEHLNQRIPVGPDAPIQAILRLSKSCGRVSITRPSHNGSVEAYAGYVQFAAVYRGSPVAEAPARLTEVTEFSLAMRDPSARADLLAPPPSAVNAPREPTVPPAARAELEGSFRFYFASGRPAQRFQ